MMQNLLQDIVLAAFVATSLVLLIRERNIFFGLIVRENGNLLANGKQGLETTFGRSCSADVRYKDPTISRRHAVVQFRPKTGLVEATVSNRSFAAETAIPGHQLEFSLPRYQYCFEYSSLIILISEAFIGLRMVAVYGEFKNPYVIFPFLILFVYITLSAVIRADHRPIVESVLCILLTYYVDAAFYPVSTGADLQAAALDAILGVGLYVFMALVVSLFLRIDFKHRHNLLRFLASLTIILLIAMNLLLATEINGAYNWIRVGPITFQPSEPIKLLLAFVLLSPTEKQMTGFGNFLYGTIMPVACFLYAFLIKDTGALLQFGMVFLISVFMQSDNFLFSLTLILAAILGCKAVLGLSVTAATRFFGWRGSNTSILASLTGSGVFENRYDYGYQSIHAMVAIKNGGLLGNVGGYNAMHGVLAANSDLVSSALVQKHGSVFLVLLLALYLVLIVSTFASLKQKTKLQQSFSMLALSGILVALFMNVGGTLGVVPLTGVVNPALSDGISAAISYGGFFGVLSSSGLSKKYIQQIKGGTAK